MIIVKLMGGLGNQMFQYAVGKALAVKWNVPLKLDVSFLNDKSFKENFTHRDYELAVFNVTSEIASEQEIKQSKGVVYLNFSFIEKIYRKFFILLGYKPYLYQEQSFNYDTSFLKKIYPLYLEGYWQSEKYFHSIRYHLLKEFMLKNTLNEENQKIKSQILGCNAISIHIRRGDYTQNNNQNTHGLCDIDYYESAMHTMEEKNRKQPSYFVFSDDIDWAKQNIQTKYPISFINHNKAQQSYIDMYLMSLCQHNIIANSSFSWWGAWLNQNPSKIVIAPEKWFANNERNYSDVIPKQWIKL